MSQAALKVTEVAEPTTPQSTVPMLGGREMSDPSAEAMAERIRKHPPPRHDSVGVSHRAAGSALGLGFDLFSSLCGVLPTRAKATNTE